MGKFGEILASIRAIKYIVEIVVAGYEAVTAFFKKREDEQVIKKADEAVDQNERANEIKDDETRLKEKADAVCKLEQVFNPDKKC